MTMMIVMIMMMMVVMTALVALMSFDAQSPQVVQSLMLHPQSPYKFQA